MPTDDDRALQLLTSVPFGRVTTSMRAMPFVAPARHFVGVDSVVLRMHKGLGYHRACGGSVVTYSADNFGSGERSLWSVQCTGTAQLTAPTAGETALFAAEPQPLQVDSEPFEPVYLRLVPQFVTVHTLDYAVERQVRHAASTII